MSQLKKGFSETRNIFVIVVVVVSVDIPKTGCFLKRKNITEKMVSIIKRVNEKNILLWA